VTSGGEAGPVAAGMKDEDMEAWLECRATELESEKESECVSPAAPPKADPPPKFSLVPLRVSCCNRDPSS